MEELSDDHVDVLILLLPPRAEETEVFPSLHAHTLHTGTKTVSSHGKITGRVKQLGKEEGRRDEGG